MIIRDLVEQTINLIAAKEGYKFTLQLLQKVEDILHILDSDKQKLHVAYIEDRCCIIYYSNYHLICQMRPDAFREIIVSDINADSVC